MTSVQVGGLYPSSRVAEKGSSRKLSFRLEVFSETHFVGISLKSSVYWYPSGAGAKSPLCPAIILGSSFIALIKEATCSALIVDQLGRPQAQASAGLIGSIKVSIKTTTRTLTIFVIAPPLGVCLFG